MFSVKVYLYDENNMFGFRDIQKGLMKSWLLFIEINQIKSNQRSYTKLSKILTESSFSGLTHHVYK